MSLDPQPAPIIPITVPTGNPVDHAPDAYSLGKIDASMTDAELDAWLAIADYVPRSRRKRYGRF